ncbi:MAG: succinate dehydrogenase, hydrophobic membrane anchor protein [Mariprofundaceae bacterium]|nr:succinate dehydrogenase, hydrophobic membrane anchor protein [Mariprofundaceae bacterium]
MVKRIKDLGSAHSGLSNWYLQRISAVILALLLPWVFVLLWMLALNELNQLSLLMLLDSFIVRMFHTLLILALTIHAYIGLKTMIEDYVHTGVRILLMGAMLVSMGLFAIWWLALIWAWGG